MAAKLAATRKGTRCLILVVFTSVSIGLTRLLRAREESLSKHRASGLPGGEAMTLMILGAVQAETGSQTEARASLTEALRLFEQIGDHAEAAETAALLTSLSVRAMRGRSPRTRRRVATFTGLSGSLSLESQAWHHAQVIPF